MGCYGADVDRLLDVHGRPEVATATEPQEWLRYIMERGFFRYMLYQPDSHAAGAGGRPDAASSCSTIAPVRVASHHDSSARVKTSIRTYRSSGLSAEELRNRLRPPNQPFVAFWLRHVCSRLSTVRFANGPKRSMVHLLGGEKIIFLNSRH